MADFIAPFEFQTWMINVFSGNPDMFLGISLIAIVGMAAYFKMTTLTMFSMIGIFVLIFSPFIQSPFIAFFSIIAALIVGISVNKIANRT